ncbi:MAG: hypothetical protein ACOX8E_06315 [Ruminococcus sp.]|jgi:hypothetical protein
MREDVICKKAENCFANAESFIYTLPGKIDEDFLCRLARLGRLEVKRNFRRPFFSMETERGVRLKGILNENVLKAGFIPEKWQEQKNWLERELEGILRKR